MLLVLCGPAGAGKSSIASGLMEALGDVHLISSDRFKGRVYERMMREVGGRLGGQEYLVVDATFYRKRWRDMLREMASHEDRVLTVLVDCSLEGCLRRNRGRENPIPEEAIHIIWREFERSDDFDMYINTEGLGVEQAVDRILRELNTPEIQPAQSCCI